MREPNLAEDRPARYRAVALLALARLSEGDTDAETLHRARTHLRRLQAYLELIGRPRGADAVARGVNRLSKLRTLQVFERFLAKLDAPRADRKAVKNRLRTTRKQLDRSCAFAALERIIRRHAVSPPSPDPEWLAERMRTARQAHADALRQLVAKVEAKPRRKRLHRLRLLIKSIRYQEEWALDRPYAMPALVQRLKRIQRILGEYEDLFQFRKLARTLGLRSSVIIQKHWRKARTRARAVSPRLMAYLGVLTGPRMRLVGSRDATTPAAG